MRFKRHPILDTLTKAAALLALQALPAAARENPPLAPGWHLERGVDAPSYAMATLSSADLDLDMAVISCEQGPTRRGLQLGLYLSGPGPLAPQAAGPLKEDPSVTLVIDGVSHPAQLLFADDFVLVADSADGATPLLSDAVIDALETGRRLEFRFDLLPEPPGQLAHVDASAAVDLDDGTAITAVRRCATGTNRAVETAQHNR